MRFPLSSDTDRLLSRSADDIPLPGWRHVLLFADLLSEPVRHLADRRSVRRSASRLVILLRPPSWKSPISPPHPSPTHSAALFLRGFLWYEPRRAPGEVPRFPPGRAASRSASRRLIDKISRLVADTKIAGARNA